jgi:hypothetical protein
MTMSNDDPSTRLTPVSMRAPASSPKPDDDGLEEATREAEAARASFHASIVEASESGRAAVHRAVASAKPLVVGALVIGGAAIVVSAARLMRRSRSRAWAPPRKPGLFGSLFRTVATRLLVAGAVRVAQHYLLPPPEEEPAPQPRPEPEMG